MSLTEYGLKWLAEKHGVPFSGSSPDGSSGRQEEKQESENELVLSLLEQLRLQAQQVLSLPAPKRSFFKRLFGIYEEKE